MCAGSFSQRDLDPKKYTQKRLAQMFGMARETVRDWCIPNGGSANGHMRPDARTVACPRCGRFDRGCGGPRSIGLVPPTGPALASVAGEQLQVGPLANGVHFLNDLVEDLGLAGVPGPLGLD